MTGDGGAVIAERGVVYVQTAVNNTRSLVPVAVSMSGTLSGRTVKAVGVGLNHTLALLADGRLAAWGSGSFGQLGNNGTAGSNVPVPVDASGLLNGRSVVKIAAGGQSCLVMCSDGTLAAWGNNDHGQLGNKSATASFGTPQAVDLSGVLNGKTFTGIHMGQRHAVVVCEDVVTGDRLGHAALAASVMDGACSSNTETLAPGSASEIKG